MSELKDAETPELSEEFFWDPQDGHPAMTFKVNEVAVTITGVQVRGTLTYHKDKKVKTAYKCSLEFWEQHWKRYRKSTLTALPGAAAADTQEEEVA